jgi:ATPase subunit of ABC transporter with duplicated ATPase domains
MPSNTVAKPTVSRSITTNTPLEAIVDSQLTSLDDTDCYATAWKQALAATHYKWGGRGQGGRGTARRTCQYDDIVVDGLRLEYVGNAAERGLSSKLLLDDAQLKFIHGHVYALVGRNGSGKSTLLRRMASKRVPGFPPHVSCLYLPQEIVLDSSEAVSTTPINYLVGQYQQQACASQLTNRNEIQEIEARMEKLNVQDESDQQILEELGERLSELEGDQCNDDNDTEQRAQEVLDLLGVGEIYWKTPMSELSPGIQKKCILAVAVLCPTQLLLLDEPTNHLDVSGLLQLRNIVQDLCENAGTTVLMISHDLDLINDLATDIAYVTKDHKLQYCRGNYTDFLIQQLQGDLTYLRQVVSLEKKRSKMLTTLEHLKKTPASKRGGSKKGSQIASQRKKMEKAGISDVKSDKDRWTGFKNEMQPGSINAMDATTRRALNTKELIDLTRRQLLPPPDKAVQFVFRNPASTWGEPLIMALDVGHGYKTTTNQVSKQQPMMTAELPGLQGQSDLFASKEGFLFDCVDLCVDEGGRYCILGENSSGKSTLLRLLAKHEEPREGYVKHALNVNIGYLDQNGVDKLIEQAATDVNAIAFLASRFPKKTEQEIRSELTAFGLSPKQSATSVEFLSGGERRRLCLAALMLNNPEVLILDQPTSDLDMESVEALIFGLKQWKGTIVVVTHDMNFLRALETKCFVLVNGKLRRLEGGVDDYLKSFGK